jgi:hypothetical protein
MEQTEELKEAMIKFLLDMAEKIRSGEVVVTGLNQSRDFERWYAKIADDPVYEEGEKVTLANYKHNPNWNYFYVKDSSMGFNYYYPKHRQEEVAKRDALLLAHPDAELVIRE